MRRLGPDVGGEPRVTISCTQCGWVKESTWAEQDELDGRFTCRYCREGLHPPHELEHEDAEVVEL